MPNGIAADQIRDINTVVGDLVALIDGGGGAPKLPPLDGSLLTNVGGSDFDKILTTLDARVVINNSGNVVSRA